MKQLRYRWRNIRTGQHGRWQATRTDAERGAVRVGLAYDNEDRPIGLHPFCAIDIAPLD